VRSPVLVDLRSPALPDLLFHLGFPLRLPDLHLDALTGPEDLALQVETATLLGVVHVEELLEPLRNVLEVGLAGLWGFDVENLAGLVEGQTAGGGSVGRRHIPLPRLRGILGGVSSLLVGLCKGTPEHPGAGDDDLRDDAMRLQRAGGISHRTPRDATRGVHRGAEALP